MVLLSRGPSYAAFTLIEVLVALVVAAAVAGAAAMGLTTALRTEETTLVLQEASLVVQSAATSFYLGAAPTGATSVGVEKWDVTYSEEVTGTTSPVPWRVMNLSPRSKPSLNVPLAFREE
ncbi:MAG: prepilin-type N-terminal cleavage/methylation domain-containing protein [Kiritimatiellae bacterium]|nr:prepilin-type N-terminal cleavage/methylation domain-containing protein [Kiritimatiellia bacterium]